MTHPFHPLSGRPGRAVHLLSLIAVCDVCSGPPLTARRRDGVTVEYWCQRRSCVRIAEADLDGHAEEVMLAYLASPEVIAQIRAGDGRHDAELDRVRGDLAAARAELAELRKAGRQRALTVATLLAVEPGLVARADALESWERELTTPTVLSVLGPGPDVERRWDAAPMSARRTVARMLLTPSVLGQLRVARAGQGRQVSAADRAVWRRA